MNKESQRKLIGEIESLKLQTINDQIYIEELETHLAKYISDEEARMLSEFEADKENNKHLSSEKKRLALTKDSKKYEVCKDSISDLKLSIKKRDVEISSKNKMFWLDLGNFGAR